ncbi:MAG: cytochrome c [Arenibacter algicola]|nr:cytochrome c [Arenibacter algicola]
MAKWTDHLPKLAVAVIVLGGAAVLVSKITGGNAATEVVNVNVPTNLSAKAKRGARTFADNCAACHGDNGAGSDKGPPLIHNIYNPGHHSDESFILAMQRGVRQHHWPYGNMPPQKDVNTTKASNIITYIREVQTANGIVYQQHRM